jgi:hypothetical protein
MISDFSNMLGDVGDDGSLADGVETSSTRPWNIPDPCDPIPGPHCPHPWEPGPGGPWGPGPIGAGHFTYDPDVLSNMDLRPGEVALEVPASGSQLVGHFSGHLDLTVQDTSMVSADVIDMAADLPASHVDATHFASSMGGPRTDYSIFGVEVNVNLNSNVHVGDGSGSTSAGDTAPVHS